MIRTCDRGHTYGSWECPWCEIDRLRAEVDRLAACKFPDSRSIYVVTLPNGERWACADVVGAEIERLRAEAGRLREALIKIKNVPPNWGNESYEMYALAEAALKDSKGEI